MSKNYTVQILTDKEFDSLPYKGISDSLGIADKEKGFAFVRRTGIKDVDEATLHHEIDELVSKHSNHEDEYGIRHKKGKKIFAKVIPIALGMLAGPLGPLAAGMISAGSSAITQKTMGSGKISGIQTALAGLGGGMGAGGMSAGIEASKAAGGSYLGQLGSGLMGTAATTGAAATKGLIGTGGKFLGMGAPATGALQGPVTAGQSALGYSNLSQVPQNLLGSAAASSALSSVGKLQGPVTAGQSAQGFTNLSQVPSLSSGGAPGLLGGAAKTAGVPTAAPTVQSAATAPTAVAPASKGFNLGSLATPKNILGAGSLLASSGIQQPEFQMPDSVELLRSKILSAQGGLTPLGQQAQSELGNILSASPTDLYASGSDEYYKTTLTNLDNEYGRQKKALAQQWNAIDPNYQQNGEYITANNMLDKSFMEVKNNYVAQEEQRRFELARTQKYQAIQDSLQVDQRTMDDLIGLTGLDVQSAAMVYGAKVADVQAIRESLGTLGSELLVRGTPQGQPGGTVQ